MSEQRSQRFPLARRAGGVLFRMVALAAMVTLVGFGIGQAAGKLMTQLPDPTKGAELLDHFTLDASLNPSVAIVAAGDLPSSWQQGSPWIPLIGTPLCGKKAEAKGVKSTQLPVATWLNQTDGSLITSEAIEFSSVQFASTYMNDAEDKLGHCARYFVVDGEKKIEFLGTAPSENPPVVDYVSRIIQTSDKSSYEVYSIFQAGKTVVALHYRGLVRPSRDLMTDLEKKLLARIDPEQFAVTTTSLKGSADLPEKSTVTVDETKISVINSASSGPSGAVPTLPAAVTEPPPSSVAPADATTTTSRKSSG